MNSGVNGNSTNRARIFETILSSPGMQETCKIVLHPTRKTVLILARVIENNLANKEQKDKDEMLSFLPEAFLNELKGISDDLLKKGNLVEFYQHMKEL